MSKPEFEPTTEMLRGRISQRLRAFQDMALGLDVPVEMAGKWFAEGLTLDEAKSRARAWLRRRHALARVRMSPRSATADARP